MTSSLLSESLLLSLFGDARKDLASFPARRDCRKNAPTEAGRCIGISLFLQEIQGKKGRAGERASKAEVDRKGCGWSLTSGVEKSVRCDFSRALMTDE